MKFHITPLFHVVSGCWHKRLVPAFSNRPVPSPLKSIRHNPYQTDHSTHSTTVLNPRIENHRELRTITRESSIFYCPIAMKILPKLKKHLCPTTKKNKHVSSFLSTEVVFSFCSSEFRGGPFHDACEDRRHNLAGLRSVLKKLGTCHKSYRMGPPR